MPSYSPNFRTILKALTLLATSLNFLTDDGLRQCLLPKSMLKKFSGESKRQRNKANKDDEMNVYEHPDLVGIIEIIKDKFYFASLIPGKKEPRSASNLYLINTDTYLKYENFYDDFGPLNIACLYKYCTGINKILEDPKFDVVVHVSSWRPEIRANAIFLVASYATVFLKKTPEEAYKLVTADPDWPLRPFQDVSIGVSNYTISLLDCLSALSKALTLGFFNFDDFDCKEYEKYEKFKNGDLNWLVPNKFIAFLGPCTEPGTALHYPEKYLNYFMKHNISAVIRLNRRNYEASRFSRAGIVHYDMFFPDGSVPPRRILRHFLQVAETTAGPIAVHCKAGLGRTGTLIAAYIMKHYMLTAREAIAWLRICRPGSVIGQQQSWLEQLESTLWAEGRKFRERNHGDENLMLRHKRGIYSLAAAHDRRAKLAYLRQTDQANKSPTARKRHSSPSPKIAPREASMRRAASVGRGPVTQGDKLAEIKMQRNINKHLL